MSYPSSIDSFSTRADGEVLYAADINAITTAIHAIELALGVTPQGIYANVAAALANAGASGTTTFFLMGA